MAFHEREIFLKPRIIHRATNAQESKIDQNAEKTPVIGGHFMQVDLIQPGNEIVLLGLCQLIIESAWHKAQSRSDDRHLDHSLIIISDFAPVFLMLRIRSVDETLTPKLPVGLCFPASPDEHRHEHP